MTDKLIARDKECAAIKRCLDSSESEFIAIYGRRRVGKTFLIEQYFERTYDFKYVGAHNMSTRDQLRGFAKALKRYSKKEQPEFKDWIQAFDALEEYLESVPNKQKKVIFIDEMPWMDSKRSTFVKALENFWNGWACGQENILLIATGSATSWMSEKLLKNKGGLHNRITCRIYLKPFSLKETEAYLKKRRCQWDRQQILQAYMAFGGIPFYLKQINVKESAAQNINNLCFDEAGMLRGEFDELYNALFASADSYIDVVRTLAKHKSGLTRQEISEKTKFNGRNLNRILRNLETCDFISCHQQYGNKRKGLIYRLADFFTLFYLNFIETHKAKDNQWWTQHIKSPEVSTWQGLTFELVCLTHCQQIKKALGFGNVSASVYTWRHIPTKNDTHNGAQIDLVIERADRLVHLFEIKFSGTKYPLTSKYVETLQERETIFHEVTKTNYGIVQTFITTYGVKNPETWSIVHSEVTMNDLFNF